MANGDMRPTGASAGDTLFMPADDAGSRGGDSSLGLSLPPDLQSQVISRLRMTTMVYAGAFFFADFFPTLFFVEFRDRFETLGGWIFGALSIALAVVAFLVVSIRRVPWAVKLVIGHVFFVAGAFGIALAQYGYLPNIELSPHVVNVLSPSWVGVWMVFFAVVVPAPPRLSIPALVAAGAAVPIVLWRTLASTGHLELLLPFENFFFRHVFQYMLCAFMAYFGGRVVFNLGAAVKRARDLGSYRLIERLGSGGMGEVWRASHRMLARPAAIKFIRRDPSRRDGDTQQALRRFELEAQATASLTSPHSVALYDYGAADDGRFYYVMELLDGLDLETLVRRFGPQPPARVVHLLVQACESLDEAHERGLVHRDIKPANLFICRSGTRRDFVKVLDFGLVARDAEHAADETRLTRPAQATGTPAYMPPEVAGGGRVDGRADIYSLGCVAYWLLTGTQVFEGSTVYDLVSRHLTVAPEPPSQRLGTRLPDGLDAVILRCLEKDPAHRPQSARQMAHALRGIAVADTWDDDRALAWWRAHGIGRDQGGAPGAMEPEGT